MSSFTNRISRGYSLFLRKYAAPVALLGTLLGGVGAYYSILLYKNLRTDIEELLPSSARSVLDLNEVTSRLESIDNLAIIISAESSQGGKRLVDDIARELSKAPRSIIAGIEYKIDQELAFFESKRALFLEVDDLLQIRKYIEDRIDYEKALYNPLNIFSTREIPEPNFDFEALKKKYESKAGSYSRYPGGYYATPDGKLRIILVNLPGKVSGVGAAHALRHAVDDAIEKANPEGNPEKYGRGIVIRFSGGVQNLIEEHAALIADLELSTIIVMVLVTFILILFYRNIAYTLSLVAALFVGTLWTFGVSYFAVGYLNANSAFLGSIVIGNGINFGIIFLARFLEERRRGKPSHRALHEAISGTATATWTAALAAGLAYGSLTLTGFRGFKQFGIIGLIGMLLCWIATFTVLPAYITWMDRRKGAYARKFAPRKEWISGFLAKLIANHPGKIWFSSFLLTVASFATFYRYDQGVLETDLSKLRDKTSMQKGSAFNTQYLDQVFQRYLSPIVIMPRSRKDTSEIAEALRREKEREGKRSLIASVQTLEQFVPGDQSKKIQILHEIRELLPERLVRRLPPEQQGLVRTLLESSRLSTFTEKDLPALVKEKFTERDKSFGRLVLVEPPLDNSTWDGNNLIRFIHQLRDVADGIAPGTPVAGQLPVSSDMIEAIQHDGPRATLFAFAAVVLLVIFLFRSPAAIVLTLFALFLGVVWLAGCILGFQLKINFLNFIALPITFGIGVDYGVNIFQRFRQEGAGNIIPVIRQTGGAVLLASLTTIIGYGSLLIAGNQAFVSFGKLAVLGELTCVFAAVISLPAYLVWRDQRKKSR